MGLSLFEIFDRRSVSCASVRNRWINWRIFIESVFLSSPRVSKEIETGLLLCVPSMASQDSLRWFSRTLRPICFLSSLWLRCSKPWSAFLLHPSRAQSWVTLFESFIHKTVQEEWGLARTLLRFGSSRSVHSKKTGFRCAVSVHFTSRNFVTHCCPVDSSLLVRLGLIFKCLSRPTPKVPLYLTSNGVISVKWRK